MSLLATTGMRPSEVGNLTWERFNDTEYAVGIYGTNGGDGISMVFLDGDADDGIVSAGTGISHNDIAVIGNVVFTATDKGVYYSKAFHSGLDAPEALSITNEGLHIADIKASQIEAGNFDGDDDTTVNARSRTPHRHD